MNKLMYSQGRGDYFKSHRCPGEWLKVDVMVNHIDYSVPKKNLRYSMKKMPSRPKSEFVLTDVSKK